MLTLRQALLGEEPDYWRAVARSWAIPYPDTARDIPAEIAAGMLSGDRVGDQYRALPDPARKAVQSLRRAGGKMPVAVFTHRFGGIRPMGPARREREQPWNHPESVGEQLWYGGWIGRTFLRMGNVTQEYFFLPEDLASMLPAGDSGREGAWALLSYEPDRDESVRRTEHRIAEDACTLLAYLRNWPQPVSRPVAHWRPATPLSKHLHLPESLPLLIALLRENGLLSGDPICPDPKEARIFLEKDAPAATAFLTEAWCHSLSWNDLAHVHGLRMEGDWPNNPVETRRRFLAAFQAAPRGEWCVLQSAVDALRETDPEYVRPVSESETWMLRDESGGFLQGLESWDRVEGELAIFLLTGPLTWFGAVDTVPTQGPRAFRVNSQADILWDEKLHPGPAREWKARIRSDGTVLAPMGMPLLLRYQLARCAGWVGRPGGVLLYRIGPRSLELARNQGVRVDHILGLLERLVEQPPPLLIRAIRRWEKHGGEAVIRAGRVLIVNDAETGRKLARWLKHGSGMATRVEAPVWLVSAAGVKTIRKYLADEGLLLEEVDEDI
jgi:hypothetical protein